MQEIVITWVHTSKAIDPDVANKLRVILPSLQLCWGGNYWVRSRKGSEEACRQQKNAFHLHAESLSVVGESEEQSGREDLFIMTSCRPGPKIWRPERPYPQSSLEPATTCDFNSREVSGEPRRFLGNSPHGTGVPRYCCALFSVRQ